MISFPTWHQVINSYFEKIVKIVHTFEGDVLKFAGDALLVQWKQDNEDTNGQRNCLLAISCAAQLVDCCSDFAVHIPYVERRNVTSEINAKESGTALLNIHCNSIFGEESN